MRVERLLWGVNGDVLERTTSYVLPLLKKGGSIGA